MVYIERTALLGELVAAALRDRSFHARASALSPAMIRQAVQDELASRGIAVTIIDVDPLPSGESGGYQVVWQPADGGKFQRLWFTIERGVKRT